MAVDATPPKTPAAAPRVGGANSLSVTAYVLQIQLLTALVSAATSTRNHCSGNCSVTDMTVKNEALFHPIHELSWVSMRRLR
jgi:hypothetical protein